jgi:hypothetical protein
MNGLQVISDSETQDNVPKPSKFIIGIPIERPNAKKKKLSQNKLFGAPTIDFGLTKEALTIHPYATNKQLVERGKTSYLQMTFWLIM